VKYPQFKQNNNPFYLSGESYAGMYIPRLAHWLIANNSDINLQGILVGNGVANMSILSYNENLMLYQHQFIPDDVWFDYE